MGTVEWSFDLGGAVGGLIAALALGLSAWQWTRTTNGEALTAAYRHLEEQRYVAYAGFVAGIAARRHAHRDYDRAQKEESWSPDLAGQHADAIHQAREEWYTARSQLLLLAPTSVVSAAKRWEEAVSQDNPLRKNRIKGLDDGDEKVLREAFLEAAHKDLKDGLVSVKVEDNESE